MSTWQEFYSQIRDPSWPECDLEENFESLPDRIKAECINNFGYVPGSFRKTSKLVNKVFPIKTDTACQLKWNWSTVFLAEGKTSGCHRTNKHSFDTDQFDFHNTPIKLDDRQQMLDGKWPKVGCEYCKNIEAAGGQSDRITNLDFPGIHAPPELDQNPTAISVTPRILEVYFDTTCNLKCLYCGPHFSSLWDAENIKFGERRFIKSPDMESNKQKIFNWISTNGHHLTVLNILGGEPLYQDELEQCLDIFEQHPAPNLKLQIFTNLYCKLPHLQKIIARIKQLVDQDKLRELEITASLDCWGAPQEYVRYPLDLKVWEANFEFLVEQDWINLIVSSTVTPLTIKTLPDLLEKIKIWGQRRQIYHYQNSVNWPSHMFIDIFGNIFNEDFERALALKPETTPEEKSSKNYLKGVAIQSASGTPNIVEITKLFNFLNTMDHRRHTNWQDTFPWLIAEFAKHSLTKIN
jgi:MoaA/NifB/PqqE/SkfB family radical SAM enzyme